jgi:hypothetical protein
MECRVLGDDERMDVLYGEADAETQRRVEVHQQTCAVCSEEMASLKRVRKDLARWTEPVTRPRVSVARGRARRFVPGWAAAAALLLAAGGAFGLSGAELRYADGQLSFRLGRPASDARDVQQLLAAERVHQRQEIEALKASFAAPAPRDDRALLGRVEEMIRDSEARQTVVLNASLSELAERGEAARRFDLARMSQSLSYLDGRTGEQVARTNELVASLLKTSQQK